jgi:hypothetical protein
VREMIRMKRILSGLFVSTCLCAAAHAQTIGNLPAASSVSPTDYSAVFQTGNVTRKATAAQITGAASATLYPAVTTGSIGAAATNCSNINAALSAAGAGGQVNLPSGIAYTSCTIVIPPFVGLMMPVGGFVAPTNNMDVVNLGAGGTFNGGVDVSANATWNMAALKLLAVSQLGVTANSSFQLNTPTNFTVYLVGFTSGVNHGTAINLNATVNPNGGVEGVIGTAWIQGFDNGLWMQNNISDGTQWVNANNITIFSNLTIRPLRMDDLSTFGGGMANNKLNIQNETRPGATTTGGFQIAGAFNQFDIEPWDYDGGSGGSVPAIFYGASNEADVIRTFTSSAAINSTGASSSNVVQNLISGSSVNSSPYIQTGTLSASGLVSGSGFTSLFASPFPLGSTTPSSGVFTTLASSNGLTGIVTGSAPVAGTVGEVLSSTPVTCVTQTGLSSATATNVASLSLPAGDWLVYGTIGIDPANTTVVNSLTGALSTTSATIPADGNPGRVSTRYSYTASAGSSDTTVSPSPINVNVSTTTTVFAVISASFTTSTAGPCGQITAVRIH